MEYNIISADFVSLQMTKMLPRTDVVVIAEWLSQNQNDSWVMTDYEYFMGNVSCFGTETVSNLPKMVAKFTEKTGFE